MSALIDVNSSAGAGRTVISVDAMGGDRGPATVVAGISLAAQSDPKVTYVLHGQRDVLESLVAKHAPLAGRCEIRHADDVVTMEDKPLEVLRTGKNTSMWSAIESVRTGEASACVSCGNTGALMLLSVVRLKKLPGIARPAIAVLWPSVNPQGYNVMLDGGADISADERDLLQFALMGASYARNGLNLARPRVGLLNNGTEEYKGRPELKAAADLIAAHAEAGQFDFVGFVEGTDLSGKVCDVIVTDGFTGNIALKTGEGTAKLMAGFLREAFQYSLLSKIAALLAYSSLRRLSKRMDPRQSNGGVFLGLNGTVVKSHGGADETGVAAAVRRAHRLGESGFAERLRARVASASLVQQDAPDAGETDGKET